MMNYTITVNLDKKCKRCGKGGAVNESGVCMNCLLKAIESGEISPKKDKRHKEQE